MNPFNAKVLKVELTDNLETTDPVVVEKTPNLPEQDGAKHHAEDRDRRDVDGFEETVA